MYPRSPHGSILLSICEIKLKLFEDRSDFIENFEIKKRGGEPCTHVVRTDRFIEKFQAKAKKSRKSV